MAARGSQRTLAAMLAALAVLFAAWFRDDPRYLQALAVFALPPLLLMAGAFRGSRGAVFWSGVFGLGWFCHGVMVGFDRAAGRGYAVGEVALALAIIIAASWPGLQARFGRRSRATD